MGQKRKLRYWWYGRKIWTTRRYPPRDCFDMVSEVKRWTVSTQSMCPCHFERIWQPEHPIVRLTSQSSQVLDPATQVGIGAPMRPEEDLSIKEKNLSGRTGISLRNLRRNLIKFLTKFYIRVWTMFLKEKRTQVMSSWRLHQPTSIVSLSPAPHTALAALSTIRSLCSWL